MAGPAPVPSGGAATIAGEDGGTVAASAASVPAFLFSEILTRRSI